jgi:HK97 family phage major capsid protein
VTAPTIPTSAAELEEMLGDDKQLKAIYEQGGLGEFVQNYVKASREKDPDIERQIREGAQAVLAEVIRDGGLKDVARPNVSPLDGAKARNKHYSPDAPGAVLDGKFTSTGDLFRTLAQAHTGNRDASTRLAEIRNDFSSAVPSDGGYLVPEEFRAELLRTSLESGIVRPKARTIPMATPRIKFPVVEDTNHASSVFGGIVGYWSEEGGQLVASSAKFGSVTLDAQKLTGYTEIPNELIEDSVISVTAFVDEVFPTALAWFEDLAFMRGTGVGEPLGFLTAGNTAAVTVAKEGSQTADTIVRQNLAKMYSRMLPTSLASAVWIANIDTFPALAELAAADSSPVWLSNLVDGPPMSILGRPVIFTEKADTLGDLGDITFVDLSYYLIGDRQQLSAMRSEHFKFNTDTTAFRFIERVDGRPWLKNAITPAKGTNTLSPFVKLQAR